MHSQLLCLCAHEARQCFSGRRTAVIGSGGETLTLIAADSWEEGRVREREEHGNKVNRGWKRIQCRLGWRESSGSGVRVRQTGSFPLSFPGRPTCRQRLFSGCGDHTQTSRHFFYSHSPVCYCLFRTAYIHWTVHQSGQQWMGGAVNLSSVEIQYVLSFYRWANKTEE